MDEQARSIETAALPRPAELRGKSRLVVIESVYYQSDGEPVSLDTRFSRILDTDDQPYVRKMTGKAEWVALESGWLVAHSLVVIRNDGKEALEVAVTGAETPIPVLDADFVIRPGESMRCSPVDIANLLVRGLTKFTLSVLPK